jgi:hypothetical protein
MTQRAQLPVKTKGSGHVPLQVNDLLTHPMAGSDNGQSRGRWKYRYLRVTRFPTIDRPDSGRRFVENVMTGKRDEFYAMLFGVTFKDA